MPHRVDPRIAVCAALLWGCDESGEPETATCDDLSDVPVDAELVSDGPMDVSVPGRGVWVRENLFFVDEPSRDETLHYLVLGTVADEACSGWESKTSVKLGLGDSKIGFALMDLRDDGNDEDDMAVEPTDGTVEALTPGSYGWQGGGEVAPSGEPFPVNAASGVLTLDNQGDRVVFGASRVVFESDDGVPAFELNGDGVFCACDVSRTIDPPDTPPTE